MKNFGLGLVYILLLPIFVAILAIAAVVGFVVCIIQFFQATVRFFQGNPAFPPFEEDLKVREIKAAQIENQIHPNPQPAVTPSAPAGPSNVYVQNNYYQHPNGQAAAPASSPAPTPIDTTGFYNPQGQPANPSLNQPSPSVPPTLDVTQSAQEIPAKQTSISANPTPIAPASSETKPAVIDLSEDDGKDEK